MQNKLILAVLVTALVVGGGSFYGGMQYQQSKAGGMRVSGGANGAGGRAFQMGGAGGQGGAGMRLTGGGVTAGEVVGKDAMSLTVKLANGGSKIVFFSTSTNVGKMDAGTFADIATGTEVTVMGTANQDGSIAASNIQIRPAGAVVPGMMPVQMRDGQQR